MWRHNKTAKEQEEEEKKFKKNRGDFIQCLIIVERDEGRIGGRSSTRYSRLKAKHKKERWEREWKSWEI